MSGTRVYKLSAELKRRYRAFRDANGLKNIDFVDLAVTGHLYQIQDELIAIGMGDAKDGDEPVKLEISDTAIDALREASEKTGISALVLARLCLSRQSQPAVPKKRTRKAAGEARITKVTKVTKKTPAKRSTRKA